MDKVDFGGERQSGSISTPQTPERNIDEFMASAFKVIGYSFHDQMPWIACHTKSASSTTVSNFATADPVCRTSLPFLTAIKQRGGCAGIYHCQKQSSAIENGSTELLTKYQLSWQLCQGADLCFMDEKNSLHGIMTRIMENDMYNNNNNK